MIVADILFIFLILLFIIGCVFVRVLLHRDGSLPEPKGGTMVSPLLEPTGAELLAYNATKLKKFQAIDSEEVNITSFDGLKLCGRFHRGTEPVTVICCHGYRSEPVMDFVAISEMYVEKGYSILFPDMRAHGKSEGKYIGFGALDSIDVKHWVQFVEELCPGDRIFLHGMSMGANAVMNSADQFHNGEVSGIIADCGFSNLWDLYKGLFKRMYHIPRFILPFYEFAAKCFAKYDFHTYDARFALEGSDIPFVYICGDEDKFVPIEMAESIISGRECGALITHGIGHAASYMAETESYRKLVLDFIEINRRIKQ